MRDGVGQLPKFRFALAHGGFGFLALGDVDHRPIHAQRRSLLVPHDCGMRNDPADFAVGALNAAFDFPLVRAGEGGLESFVHPRSFLRQDVLQKHVVSPFRQQSLVAENLVVLERAPGTVGRQVEIPGADPPGFQAEAQTLFAPLQLGRNLPAFFLRFDPVGNVEDHSGQAERFACLVALDVSPGDDMAPGTVVFADAVLGEKGRPFLDRLRDRRLRYWPVLRMD